MRLAALALRDLIARIGGWFGIEGAFLVVGAICLAIWSYFALAPYAPWAVVGALCVVAWLALTLRRP